MNLVTLDQRGTQAWLEGSGPEARPSIAQALTAIRAVPEPERAGVARRVLDAEISRELPRASLTEQLEDLLAEEEAA